LNFINNTALYPRRQNSSLEPKSEAICDISHILALTVEGLLVPRPTPIPPKLEDYTMAVVLDYLFTSGGRFLNPQPEETHFRSNRVPHNVDAILYFPGNMTTLEDAFLILHLADYRNTSLSAFIAQIH
jgi:hypothetical protein